MNFVPYGFTTHSESSQDIFVYVHLVQPFDNHSGTFLDIGCSVPIDNNNTYSLEQLGWRGLLVDLSSDAICKCKQQRTSPAIQADATQIDWLAVCKEHNLGTNIDYLSLDIDDEIGNPFSRTLLVLRNLISSGFIFKAITVEHNCYSNGDKIKNAMRQLLRSQGYTLFAADVYNRPRWEPWSVPFEDWWLKR